MGNRVQNIRTKMVVDLQSNFWGGSLLAGFLVIIGHFIWEKDNYLQNIILTLIALVILFFVGRGISNSTKDDLVPLIDKQTQREKKLAEFEVRKWSQEFHVLPLLKELDSSYAQLVKNDSSYNSWIEYTKKRLENCQDELDNLNCQIAKCREELKEDIWWSYDVNSERRES